MTKDKKIEWAKRAFEEIARICEDVATMPIVDTAERNAWRSVAAMARRDAKILEP